MKKTWFSAVVVLFSLLLPVAVHATIGAAFQMQLGNPSGAAVDPNNHDHYLLVKDQYAMDYNDHNGEPNWVSWDLTVDDLGASGRSNNFIPDTTLPPSFYEVVTGDYTGSGYDRGHMCPSADRTVTAADNQQTFILSNILPQAPDNNQGVWANFEGYCRTLASGGNEVLITSGGSGYGGSRIPSGKAAIPGYTWKIVVVVPLGGGDAVSRITPSTRVIAIKIPNIAGVRSTPWQNFVTSVAQIESDTGFTFFTALPPTVANALRTVVDGQSAAGTPSIVAQPAPQTTVVGGSATFSVTANGDAPLTYQWLHDDEEIDGATSATLTLGSVQAGDLGNYYVVVSNAVGSATSNAAALVITGLPPVIKTPPAAQIVGAGANVTFSVTASGSPTLTYQWRKEGAPLGGATAAILSLNNVQAGDIGNYDVVVTNSVGFATSSSALLTVNPAAPTISGQPASKSVSTGGNASFTVTAAGTAPLSYQWRKGGAALPEGGAVTGTTTATLLFTGATAANGGDYDVVVANDLGSVTSNPATLTVNPPPPSTVVWDFGPSAAPTATPSNGLNDDLTGGTVTQGNNNGTTPLVTTTSASSGYTGVSGANNIGAAARIGALNPGTSAYFEFTLAPSAGKRLLATGISFGMRSTGTGPQAFGVFTSLDSFAAPVASGTIGNDSNWHLFSPAFTAVTGATGQPVTFRIYGYNGAGSPGAGTANWRVDDLKLTINAVFPPPVAPAVVATTPADGAGNIAVTAPLTVTFNEAVSFSGSWFSINSALEGPLAATVTGGPTTFTLAPPATWSNNDTITVTIFGAQVVDQASGTIHGAGNTTFTFGTEAFVPPTPPSVTTQPAPQTVNAGGNASFTVAAIGTPPFTYQWRKDGVAISGNVSATTATLALTGVPTTASGNYDCVVSNVAGSDVSHPALLTVNVVPASVATQPIGQMAVVGGNATFTVVANGTGPFTYHWRRNGVALTDGGEIAGSATATLTLTGVTANDSATYDVVVGNATSSVTSSPATLAVSAAAPSAIVWDFATANPTSGVPAGVTGGTVTQGNNNGATTLITAVSVSSGYTGVSGGNNAGAAARIGALSQGAGGSAYFEFTFTPPAGRQFAATGISFGARSTGTGPQAIAIYSSVDNFTAPVASTAVFADSAWHLLTPAFGGVTGAAGAPVTFRLFGFNGTGSPAANTANWRIDDLKLTAGLLAQPAFAPTVTSVSPIDGATNIALNAPVQITFNQAVNVTGMWFAVSSAAHGPVPVVVSGGPQAFTFTPAADYAYGDTITVTIFGAQVVEQATGTLPLAGDAQFSFATIPPLPPLIGTSPVDRTATVGDNVSFTVAATSTVPLSYQWRKGGDPITGNLSATTTTLTLSHVTTADAGNYDCVVSNGGGSATSEAAVLTVNKAEATIALSNLVQTYTGGPHSVSFVTTPAGLAVDVTYNGSSTPPTNTGNYAVVATITDPNYTGTASAVLTIGQIGAEIALDGLRQRYDGTPRAVTVTTVPSGLATTVTYNGSTTVPTAPGSYAVVATIHDPNYAGSASGTLVVTITALVRHAPALNGGLDGSIQQLLPEGATLNGNAWVSGDLLVPGLPAVRLNGHPSFVGTIDASGSATPSNYTVTLNGNALLRNLVRRTDAIALPVVTAPPAPVGTRNVSINAAGQAAGDFATIRNLTLNGNAGQLAVPAGTYGTLTANGSSGFILGVADATEPAVYNLQGLTLNGSSRLEIVGPVVINLAGGISFNGSLTTSGHPEWLELNVASGSVTLNGNVTVEGFVTAPSGTVTINGNSTLTGGVISDRLTINGNGLLKEE